MVPADETEDDCLDDPIRLFDYEQNRVFKCSEITSVTIEDPGYHVDLGVEEDRDARSEKYGLIDNRKSLVASIPAIDVNLTKQTTQEIEVIDNEKNVLYANKKNCSISHSINDVIENCTMKLSKIDTEKIKIVHSLFEEGQKADKGTSFEMATHSEYATKKEAIKPKNNKKDGVKSSKCLSGMKTTQKNVVPVTKCSPISNDIKIKKSEYKTAKEISEVDIYDRIITKAYKNLKTFVKPSSTDGNNVNTTRKSIGLNNDFNLNMCVMFNMNDCKVAGTSVKPLELSKKCTPSTDDKKGEKSRSKSSHISPVRKETQCKKDFSSYFVTPTILNTTHFKVSNDCYLLSSKNVNAIRNENSHMDTCIIDKPKHKMIKHNTRAVTRSKHRENLKKTTLSNGKINEQEVHGNNKNQDTMTNSFAPSHAAAPVSEKNYAVKPSSSNKSQYVKSRFKTCNKNIVKDDKIIPHYHKRSFRNKNEGSKESKSDEVTKDSSADVTLNNLPLQLLTSKKSSIEIRKNEIMHNSPIDLTTSVSQGNLSSLPVSRNSTQVTVVPTENWNHIIPNIMNDFIPTPPNPFSNLGINENYLNKGTCIPNKSYTERADKHDKCNMMSQNHIPVLLNKTNNHVPQSHDNVSSVFPIQSIVSNRSQQDFEMSYNLSCRTAQQEHPISNSHNNFTSVFPIQSIISNRQPQDFNTDYDLSSPFHAKWCPPEYFYNNTPGNTHNSAINYPTNATCDINFACIPYGCKDFTLPQVHCCSHIPIFQQYLNSSRPLSNVQNANYKSNVLPSQQIVNTNDKKDAKVFKNNTINKSPDAKATMKTTQNTYCNKKQICSCKRTHALAMEKQNTFNEIHHANIVENKNLRSYRFKEMTTHNIENNPTQFTTAITSNAKTQEFASDKPPFNPHHSEIVSKHPKVFEALKQPLITDQNSLHEAHKSSRENLNVNGSININVHRKEYSPPILPILSFESMMEMIESDEYINYYTQQYNPLLHPWPINGPTWVNNHNRNPHHRPDSANITNKRKIDHDDKDKNKKARKISLREHKQRAATDMASIENIRAQNINTTEISPPDKYSEDDNLEDLNCDSDATAKL